MYEVPPRKSRPHDAHFTLFELLDLRRVQRPNRFEVAKKRTAGQDDHGGRTGDDSGHSDSNQQWTSALQNSMEVHGSTWRRASATPASVHGTGLNTYRRRPFEGRFKRSSRETPSDVRQSGACHSFDRPNLRNGSSDEPMRKSIGTASSIGSSASQSSPS